LHKITGSVSNIGSGASDNPVGLSKRCFNGIERHGSYCNERHNMSFGGPDPPATVEGF